MNADAKIVADIADFQVNEGYSYLFMDEETPVVSATSFMKKSWIDAGRPYLEGHPSTLEDAVTSGRAAGRSCNSYNTGDTLTAPTSGVALMYMWQKQPQQLHSWFKREELSQVQYFRI